MLVRDFIEVVLFTEIEKMTLKLDGYASHAYVGFSLVASSIEVLGACLDDNDWSKAGLSEARFRLAIKELFPVNYNNFNDNNNVHDLYAGLRCSLVHSLRPGILISLSERKHEDAAGIIEAHLTIQDERLLLIYEDFLLDFKKACECVMSMIDKKEIKHDKVYGHSISVPNDRVK